MTNGKIIWVEIKQSLGWWFSGAWEDSGEILQSNKYVYLERVKALFASHSNNVHIYQTVYLKQNRLLYVNYTSIKLFLKNNICNTKVSNKTLCLLSSNKEPFSSSL